MRREYNRRNQDTTQRGKYAPAYRPNQFMIQQRLHFVRRALAEAGMTSLHGKRILEVGCGSGGVLQEYLALNHDPGMLFGIDLLFERLSEAHTKLPTAGISGADGRFLPFPEQSFDVLLQYTAFSSVLDSRIKEKMAGEMLRVLKRDGFILWYDFWLNPTNTQTQGIRPKEIKSLFAGCQIRFLKITLAPPIARRIVPLSWKFAQFLESLLIFNSHYLAMIHKDSGSRSS